MRMSVWMRIWMSVRMNVWMGGKGGCKKGQRQKTHTDGRGDELCGAGDAFVGRGGVDGHSRVMCDALLLLLLRLAFPVYLLRGSRECAIVSASVSVSAFLITNDFPMRNAKCGTLDA
ncbi:uncharacterized protein PV07_04245 [Cladophialophora immunda]|uniref:Uncharacterized protein n=1 Tax=Cladophialophora immunda TaxID=569365 RepID=A0A0D2B552_9EURO|nr:uncharacterized protein PV07_04245 [Cladophialophora immunda]KIW32717.1 hypothetical protein PV07_04245 [Cladophialophora immunda]